MVELVDSPKMAQTNTAPVSHRVSVIVPTRNSSRTIDACLESIRNQAHSPIETIVVDNASADGTPGIASRFTPLVYSAGPERGAQKNYGFRKSSGAFVLFIDSDMVLEREVVGDCLALSGQADMIMIPEHSIGEGFWAASRTLERSCYMNNTWTGAARFFPRQVFESLRGFDETLQASGDDMDLHQRGRRMGYSIGSIASTILHDEGLVTPRDTFRKWRYYGRNMIKYVRKNKEEALLQYSPIRPAWVRNWRKLSRDPSHTAGFIVLKWCQLLGVVVGHLDSLRGNPQSTPYWQRDKIIASRA
jgi:glycosyltransferase involved in cell wall biosynthesis